MIQSFLTDLYANPSSPFISAVLLGLLIAIAPCPMTLNITAIGFIGKDLSRQYRIFSNGIFYTLGTVFSYTGLVLILYFGADQFRISSLFQQYSEWITGPLLLVVGLFMSGLIKVDFPVLGKFIEKFNEKFRNRESFQSWDSFLLGMVLALSFCPYSGVLYFGTLVPLVISNSSPGLGLVFSLSAGIPVVIFAWLLAFSVNGVGRLFNSLKSFENWFRKIIAVIFAGVGIYYIIEVWIL